MGLILDTNALTAIAEGERGAVKVSSMTAINHGRQENGAVATVNSF